METLDFEVVVTQLVKLCGLVVDLEAVLILHIFLDAHL